MPRTFKILFCLVLVLVRNADSAQVRCCFTPPRGCTQQIVAVIDQAKQSIYVQAYSFTSQPITDALIKAHQRGLKVAVLLDKSQETDRHSRLSLLQVNHIPVYIDKVSGIAHNKVMIVDKALVITGSFNFTNAAETRNAENVVFIEDPEIASLFLNNWQERFKKAYQCYQEAYQPGQNFDNLLKQITGWLEDKLK